MPTLWLRDELFEHGLVLPTPGSGVHPKAETILDVIFELSASGGVVSCVSPAAGRGARRARRVGR